ncbi:MAG: hypothetical protein AAF773_06340 [Cyanobacteria bacterium P01_D01_bin.115]
MAVIRRKTNYMYEVTSSDPSLKGFKEDNQSQDISRSFQVSQPDFDWVGNTNAFQRIKALLSLSDDWDGYGAKAFSRQQVQSALDLYSEIYQYYFDNEVNFSRLYPFVAPCSDGSILLEWSGDRFPTKQLELFVCSDVEDNLFDGLKSTEQGDDEVSISLEEVSQLLDWLFDK